MNILVTAAYGWAGHRLPTFPAQLWHRRSKPRPALAGAGRRLLAEHAIPPSTARFRTPTDVAAHLGKYSSQPPRKIKPAC
ncbi:hypothetical protein GCM10010207_56840 [Streptomyces atratus]|nr:hypothetical protein GCM10010207_56840 [Streptomyces atratus]